MISNGCPAPRTLVRLEVAPNHHARRYSFMFPKINVGIAELQFVYLHCEMELKEVGHRPQCFRQNDAMKQRNQAGRGDIQQRGGRFNQLPSGRKSLGGRQYFYREYGMTAEDWQKKANEKKEANGIMDAGGMPDMGAPILPSR